MPDRILMRRNGNKPVWEAQTAKAWGGNIGVGSGALRRPRLVPAAECNGRSRAFGRATVPPADPRAGTSQRDCPYLLQPAMPVVADVELRSLKDRFVELKHGLE